MLSPSNRISLHYHVGCTEPHTQGPGGALPIQDQEPEERSPAQKVMVAILVFTSQGAGYRKFINMALRKREALRHLTVYSLFTGRLQTSGGTNTRTFLLLVEYLTNQHCLPTTLTQLTVHP